MKSTGLADSPLFIEPKRNDQLYTMTSSATSLPTFFDACKSYVYFLSYDSQDDASPQKDLAPLAGN